MKLIKLFILLLAFPMCAQQGGMWIPSLLEGMNETEMQNLGMKMSAADIYSVNQSSLKDAVPHFNGGCTSEVISPKGLLLTNHHCGYSQIQSHSTVENDYLTDGFWAKNLDEELANPGMTVTFIVEISDVTKKVLEGTENASSEEERQQIIAQNKQKVVNNSPKEEWQTNRVSTFYDGNQFMLFRVETFKDIRLVGAPPSSIGKYGSDTDNWMWPRHTGDFSLFRIYADKNNRPAEYSEDNVPYTPKHYLPVSLDGVAEDDFTLVFGFPGTTDEYLPAVAIEQLVETINPARIGLREVALKEQDVFMRKDQEIKIKYASKYASIANYHKKWIGESQGLTNTNVVGIKKDQEKEFMQQVKAKGLQDKYGHILKDFDKAYAEFKDYDLAYNLFSEAFLRNVELLRNGFQLYQLEQVLDNRGEQSFTDRKESLLNRFESGYKDYSAKVDEKVFEKVIEFYAENMPEEFLANGLQQKDKEQLTEKIYNNSALTTYADVEELMQGSPQEIVSKLNEDPGYAFVKKQAEKFYSAVLPTYQSKRMEIDALQKEYMKAIVELSSKSDRIFPNANGTLRVTYGQVKGYSPKDAVYYEPVTHLEGVMQKYVEDDYEFDVPQKLIDLYENKDYGQYAENGKLPVNFIGTNHTTGGNSGSPVIDAHGNLIGLNFDRVWEGTMSDYYYDPIISRNIMVDARYILFIIDKYANATHLIDEMKLVHPKKNATNKKKKNKRNKRK
ncbi:S46 family peptidase [Haloflavibacter putidus]|uniref:Dipeptidyl-peptidase n=1 Tax=Haloflavibacter putidus TaxID=2576776 RepID=A0A507ZVZ2_9FLAO|nr:S46 family peptidase [Haloflavibacter putidus]TQD39868.1 S46 family peptidase [Haloflavibacter putidus]